jgi:protein tyrosine phosphatase
MDHCELTANELEKCVDFCTAHNSHWSEQKKTAEDPRVYVHCKAGHGRSAGVVLSYLFDQSARSKQHAFGSIQSTLKTLNTQLLKERKVRKTLWRQKSCIDFSEGIERRIMNDEGKVFGWTEYNAKWGVEEGKKGR